MGLIWTLIVGLVAGALAKLAMPGSDPGGIGTTMALGVGGSLLANFSAGRLICTGLEGVQESSCRR